MSKVAHIPEIFQRFINRKRLNEIKIRIGRVPFGHYVAKEQSIQVCYVDEEREETGETSNIARIEYPGVLDAFVHMKQDVEDLIRHVENADKENDALLHKIKDLEESIRQYENILSYHKIETRPWK